MMKRHAIAALLAGLLLAGTAHAATTPDTQAAHVRASHAWLRLLPANLPAAGYVTLVNDDNRPARLVDASSPVYAEVMLHRSSEGMSGMSEMAMVDHLDIPAHGQVALAPAGYHLMLEQAAHPPKVGDTVKVTLHFADGSTLDTDLLVRPANAVDTSH